MEAIAVVAALAAFVLAWWWFNRVAKGHGWKGYVRHPIGLVAGAVGFAVVAAVLMPVQAPAPTASTVEESGDVVPTLSLSPERFLQRFNERMAVTSLPHRGTLLDRTEGPANDAQIVQIDPLHSIVLTLDQQTGSIISLMYIGQGDGTARSGGEVLVLATTALIATAHAESPQAVSTAIQELLENRPDAGAGKRIVGNVELGFQESDVLGSVFTAEPAHAG